MTAASHPVALRMARRSWGVGRTGRHRDDLTAHSSPGCLRLLAHESEPYVAVRALGAKPLRRPWVVMVTVITLPTFPVVAVIPTA